MARPATRALAPHALARAGCACAVAALVMAVLVLLGWTADIPSLRVLRTGWVSMKPNSALCLMLAALGLMSAASQRFRAGGCLAVAALALVAGATGLQYLLNVDLRIDELLVIDALGDTLHPGRMAQVTVLNFLMMAAALALRLRLPTRPSRAARAASVAARALNPHELVEVLHADTPQDRSRRRQLRAIQALALIVGIGSLLVVVGYAYGEPAMFQLAGLENMALHSALAFCLLSVGLLCATPHAPLMRTLSGDLQGSLLARVFLPVLLTLPVLLGWLRLEGQAWGWFGPAAGTALLVVTLSAALGLATFWTMARLDREERTARRQRTLLNQVFDSMGDAVAVADETGRVTYVNARYEELTGRRPDGLPPEQELGYYVMLDVQTREPIALHRVPLIRALAGEAVDEAELLMRSPPRGMRAVPGVSPAEPAPGELLHITCTARPLRDPGGRITGSVVVFRDTTERQRAQQQVQRSHHDDQTHGEALALFNQGWDRARMMAGFLDLLARRHPYPAAAFYRYDEWRGSYLLEAHHGTPAGPAIELRPGEGLLGQAVLGSGPTVLTDAVEGLQLDVGFARLQPAAVVVLPVQHADMRHGVLVLAATRAVDEPALAFLCRLGAQLGLTLHNLRQYDSVKQLAAELRRRSDEVADKNRQLEAADRHKSEFLANMSHELRTPLNAILGFSQVLQAGLAGELSERQRDAIGSIHSSGEHLLSLINDILDLSKIEAGHMTLDREPVDLQAAAAQARALLREQAQGARVGLSVAEGAPLWVSADPRKVKQILYNLVSNAVKFTPRGGEVRLQVATAGGRELAAQRPQLRVGAALAAGAHYAGISVHDSGIGIEQAGLSRLFQPFVQLDSSLARQYGGTGLGLALVRRLVELHDGCIDVDSTPGQGSRFTVWLRMEPLQAGGDPAATAGAGQAAVDAVSAGPPASAGAGLSSAAAGAGRPPAARGMQAAPALAAAEAAPPGLGDPVPPLTGAPLLPAVFAGLSSAAPAGPGHAARTALVVEDDPLAADMLRALLRQEGFDSVLVTTGEQALAQAIEQARQRPYDLITLDLLLPGMDGWQTLERLRAEPALTATPVVIVSIIARDHERRGVSVGARGILQKPVRREEFLAVLDELGLRGGEAARRHVLVVDDDPAAVDILRSYLQAEPGIEVQTAYGGAEAIELARRLLPDLIVLDLMMPEVTGFDVVEALQADPRAAAIPLLIVTAKQLQEGDLRRLRGRVRRVLDKGGFSPEAFLNEIRRAVGSGGPAPPPSA
ncbi:MAG: response regulator [Burkholderiales bacterium]|nr:response regulator [Burkholderiales bacterium]